MGRRPHDQREVHIKAEVRRIIERSIAPVGPSDLIRPERKPRPSIGELLEKLRRALMKS
jgi:hypothetical protein